MEKKNTILRTQFYQKIIKHYTLPDTKSQGVHQN